jgi:HlyD family secretion protein
VQNCKNYNQSEISKLNAELKDLDSREAELTKSTWQDTTTRKKEIQEIQRQIVKLEQQLGDSGQVLSPHSGRILEIILKPGQIINAGDRLATIEAETDNSKLVGITYFSVGDGKNIQPGMTVQITPQTVKRETFGGIVGKVIVASQFPITKESAISEVGNPEVVEALVSKQQGLIQVRSELQLSNNNPSGYQWSSSTGPQLKISAGTTTSVRVKVEERMPISFILPIFKAISGLD